MTQKQIERIVWAWQQRLGLISWDLKVNFTESCSEDADATTWRSNTYERAEMRFAPEWRSWSKSFTNVIVVHELVHLLTRDVEESMKPAHDGSEASRQIERQQDREIEGLVDKLAYRFVEMGGLIG